VDRTGLGRTARKAAAAAAVLGSAVPMAGCGVFSPGVDQETPVAMTVSSGAFSQNTMAARFTCSAGAQAINPPLGWAGAPPGTKSLALVVDDSNAPITPYVYWLVFDINPATSQIIEGQVPPGARVARNSAGAADYNAPCPGPHSHEYRFTVYALNKELNLPSGTSLSSAWTAIADSTIGRGRKTAWATSSDTP
jgi:Raf kinase inhibitor-like YbhB/YbcL family protein